MDSETVHGTVRSGVTSVPHGRAVILEVSGRWMEAAEAWRRAACIAPRTDWQQFARKKAEHCPAALPGKGVMKKAAFITPEVRRLKGVYEICFF